LERFRRCEQGCGVGSLRFGGGGFPRPLRRFFLRGGGFGDGLRGRQSILARPFLRRSHLLKKIIKTTAVARRQG
jgi:hypothetical protein